MTKKIKKAFTLAEVLITLAIIGVVAAMTLPTLILKHQKQQWVTGLQNAYSTISNGFNLMKTQEGTNSLYDTEFFNINNNCLRTEHLGFSISDEELEACLNILKQYFKIVDYKNYDFYEKSDSGLYEYKIPAYILNNGISLSIVPGWVFVDVNGNKKPNKYGRDKFILQYFDNGKVISNVAFTSEGLFFDNYMEMPEDVYLQLWYSSKDNGSLPCGESSDCSFGQAIDYEFKNNTFNFVSALYADIVCNDLNDFWTCRLAYAAKACPSFKPNPDDPEVGEADGGAFCAARIMADGWKMNY